MSGTGETRRRFGRLALAAGAAGVLPRRALAADTIAIASVASFSGPVSNLGHGTFKAWAVAS